LVRVASGQFLTGDRRAGSGQGSGGSGLEKWTHGQLWSEHFSRFNHQRKLASDVSFFLKHQNYVMPLKNVSGFKKNTVHARRATTILHIDKNHSVYSSSTH
jgi:hypothetical protein